jgi:spore coat protein U-like protein
MHSRFVRFLFLGALLLMTLPVAAFAQTSRVEGMAIQGDYIKDYTGIYTYTSQVSNVGNLVYGELGVATGGTPVDRSVGAVMGDWWEGRYGTWAIHMRQFTPEMGQGDATSSPSPGNFGSDPNFNANQQFDLMWGKKFGTTSFGVQLHRSFGELEIDNDLLGLGNFGSLKYDYNFPSAPTAATANLSRNVIGVAAGLGWEMSPSTNVELAAHYQSRTFELSDTNGVTIGEANGKSTYQIAARAWWQWQPNVMVVPVFKWYSYDLATSTGSPAVVADNSLKGWQLGIAGNWTVGSNDLFILGTTFAQNKVEQEADIFGAGFANGTITETFSPQTFAALETHVNNWLSLRFGANKGAWHTIKVEDKSTPGSYTIHNSPFSMSLGAGVKLGSLQLDAIMNDAFPQNGLNFISGQTTSPLFPKVTATYSF